jgi:predicted O-linked N-acetylglucosamine transferase (SPINDLY family)
MSDRAAPISQAYQQFLQGNYDRAVELYEHEIARYPDRVSNYWYLGLALLLQRQEAEAQMVWMTPMLDADLEQARILTSELVSVLQTEVERQRAIAELSVNGDRQNLKVAWTICQHIREIDAENLFNLWQLLQLSLELGNLDTDNEILGQIIGILSSLPASTIPDVLIQKVLQQLLNSIPIHPLTFQLANACLASNSINADILFAMLFAKKDVFMRALPIRLALEFGELCLQLQPNSLEVIANLINLYQNAGKNLESVKLGQAMLAIAHKLEDRIAANYLITRGFMQAGGYWTEAQTAYYEYMQLLRSLIRQDSLVDINHILNMPATGAFAFYFEDRPRSTHKFLRELGEFTQAKIQNHFRNQGSPKHTNDASHDPVRNLEEADKIRVGYLSKCLRRHSVGWISRWLFHYHDRDRFEICAYSLVQTGDDIQHFIAQNCMEFRHLSPTDSIDSIARQLRQDRIDILVDLDSLTSNNCYGVLALRPAPIQVTWLGMDAPELPSVDYFIGDPYVLPEDAGSYYGQKIWRLPQTYVAVNGFEVAVPSLRRQHLDISPDATIYLSCQVAMKRHPHTARLQLQIIKSVSNSYLLIKGGGEPEVIQQFFEQIAEEEEVSRDRLRFLPEVPSEEIHRANLGIADVVLDTYPYNGATTTLETLWMGIPLVTKVGKQFAARNSYTMMINAGIVEGIAHTDEEYVEWGICLGNNPSLRQQISWRLHQSRQTSPLWNTESFARNMETAYKQMWLKYLTEKS